MLKDLFQNLKESKPLIYSVTNNVTINDCANALFALGASAIMSSEILEVKDLVNSSKAVNINIGTINKKSFKLMKLAGKVGNKYKKPVVLDVVGVGASDYRKDAVKKLMKNIDFSVIKGNITEIKSLAKIKENVFLKNSSGVDAIPEDEIKTSEDLVSSGTKDFLLEVKNTAKKLNTVIVITGPIDLVISKKNIVIIENGSPLMGKVCGTGCILSAIIAAFLGSIDEGKLKREETENACITALCTYGICGELASNSIKKTDGVILFKNKLIDYLSTIKAEDITKYAKYKSI